jgi:hypothetical protein
VQLEDARGAAVSDRDLLISLRLPDFESDSEVPTGELIGED